MAGESSTIDTSELGDAFGTVEEHSEQPSGFVISDSASNSNNPSRSFGERFSTDRLLGGFRRSGTDRDRATGRENSGGTATDDGYSGGKPSSPNLEAKSTSSVKLKTQLKNGLQGAYHQLAINFGPMWELDDDSASWVAGPASGALRSLSSDIENMPPKVCAIIAVGALVAITLPKIVQTIEYRKAFLAGAAQAQRDMQATMQRATNTNQNNTTPANGFHAPPQPEPRDGEVPIGERIVTPKDELMGIYAN